MPRLKLLAVLVLALLMAGQLALHHHSLNPEAGNQGLTCGVCAFSADHVDATAPTTIHLVLTAILLPAVERATASALPLTLTTRGPPQS